MMGRWWLLLVLIATGAGAYAYFDSQCVTCCGSRCASSSYEPASTEPTTLTLSDSDWVRQDLLATLAVAPGQSYPGLLQWGSLQQFGNRAGVPLENLLQNQPLAFLEMCLQRYEREVTGYTLTMLKRERVGGKLYPPEGFEKIRVHFREKPFSVHFTWLEHAKLAQKLLYVEGKNDNKMLVRPTGRFLGALVVSRAVDSADAKESGHYLINEFGVYLAMKRSVVSMRKAQARGTLHLRYDGVVTLHEIGDRPCYKFVRTPYEPPEENGVNELTLFVDQETWLQVGSIVKDSNGQLIGEYYFRDIELNPPDSDKQFQRGAV
jgi:hypothetical protein